MVEASSVAKSFSLYCPFAEDVIIHKGKPRRDQAHTVWLVKFGNYPTSSQIISLPLGNSLVPSCATDQYIRHYNGRKQIRKRGRIRNSDDMAGLIN